MRELKPDQIIEIDEDGIVHVRKFFEMNIDECRSLYKYLSKEFITREPIEDYENVMNVIKGLAKFIESNE